MRFGWHGMRPVAGLLCAAALAALGAEAGTGKLYRYFLAGNSADVQSTPTAGYLLAGGGDTPEDAFRWFLTKAGGGDVVILRASGDGTLNSDFRRLASVDSVETLLFRSAEAARDPFVVERIRHAEALFIAGGDQWNYVRMWRGNAVGAAIDELIAKGVPVGGTSAGLAVLGEFAFSAEHDTVTSKQALANPFDARVTVTDNFLHIPVLRGIITDSHFGKRDRMGRSLVFLARIFQSGKAGPVSGIGVDEGSAVLVEGDGAATVSGPGYAYFLRADRGPETCTSGRPLSFREISVYRLGRGGTFDLKKWAGSGGTDYTLSVEDGTVTSTQAGGSIY
ncbi:MAG: cyanophycinase [Bryobacteraceae bacterium]